MCGDVFPASNREGSRSRPCRYAYGRDPCPSPLYFAWDRLQDEGGSKPAANPAANPAPAPSSDPRHRGGGNRAAFPAPQPPPWIRTRPTPLSIAREDNFGSATAVDAADAAFGLPPPPPRPPAPGASERAHAGRRHFFPSPEAKGGPEPNRDWGANGIPSATCSVGNGEAIGAVPSMGDVGVPPGVPPGVCRYPSSASVALPGLPSPINPASGEEDGGLWFISTGEGGGEYRNIHSSARMSKSPPLPSNSARMGSGRSVGRLENERRLRDQKLRRDSLQLGPLRSTPLRPNARVPGRGHRTGMETHRALEKGGPECARTPKKRRKVTRRPPKMSSTRLFMRIPEDPFSRRLRGRKL